MNIEQLIELPESDWLEWKAKYPGPLLGHSTSSSWNRGKAELLKDLVAMANGEGRETGLIVYGVTDHGTYREVNGVTKHFDDAEFQTWARTVFDPIPQFRFSERQHKEFTIGVLEVDRIPEYPHVVGRTIGEVLYEGQVWLRQGTRNITAKRSELSRMFLGDKPYSFSRIDDPILTDAIHRIESATGMKATMRRFEDLDSLLQQGFVHGYYPGTRRPILIGINNRGTHDLVLLLR
jgi:predicted HTH transcriptional regulator